MGKMCGCCGLEVSSWFVWMATGKSECRGALSAERRRKRASLGGGSFFSKGGMQPTSLKEMGLGFCGCPNFFVLKLLSSKFSPFFL